MVETLPCDRSNGSLRARDRIRAGSPGAFCVAVGGGVGDELGKDSVRQTGRDSPFSNDVTGIVLDFLRGEMRGSINSVSFVSFCVVSG